MRIGQNPAKFVGKVAKPERITVEVMNYIPILSGYYAETLELVKLCLSSARREPGLPFDLLVFDNGSCPEVQDWLLGEQRAGNIQYLMLSGKNLGKGGAWNQIFGGAPGEIIAYADSDVLFYPNWLARSVELLETFPNVGMVTGRPFRTNPEFYSATVDWAENSADVRLERGNFIPWQTFLEFDLSLGQDESQIKNHYENSADVKLSFQGLTALAGASHWQFTAYKAVLAQFLPFEMDRPMGQVRQLDQRMNEAGLLRLMVPEPLAMNMSNTLRGVDVTAKALPSRKSRRLLDLPFIKAPLLGLYDRIFRWYYDR
jgi:glycosyltransferase involved in cell wall biosynthesis